MTDETIINLGCGTDNTGIGIDINYNPDIRADLNNGIPLENDYADTILARHVLEHLDNPSYILNEIKRVLKPTGKAIIEVPNVGWLPVRAWLSQDLHSFWQHKNPDKEGHWLARRLGRTEPERTPHRSLWTKQLLEDYLDTSGFNYTIQGKHYSRNLKATATLQEHNSGPMLHAIERTTGEDHSSNDYWAQTRANIITAWVQEHEPNSVLDVGCGSGYVTRAIQESLPDTDVTGIDTNEESIQLAESYDSDVTFEVYDAYELHERNEEYDVIVFADVLEHFTNPHELLNEARYVLGPMGRVVVSVPAFRWLWGPHDEANDHEERYTPARLQEVGWKAKYELKRHRYTNLIPLVPYFVYQRVLEKPVPSGARGTHSNQVLEWIKKRLIRVESRVRVPVGVTLIAELGRMEMYAEEY